MSRNIKRCYLTSWVLSITLLFFQYGYGITYFNNFTEMLYKQFEKNGRNFVEGESNFNSIVSSMIPIGALIGAFIGGFLPSIGRKKAIMLLDLLIIIGALLTIVLNFWTLLAGRFIIGIGIGAANVVGPLFVNEICPIELTGSMGAILQIQVTIGFIFAYLLGFLVPYEYQKEKIEENEEIYTSTIWRWIFLIPAFVATFQLLLLFFIFTYDSPKYYSLNKRHNLEIESLRLVTREDSENTNETIVSVTNNDSFVSTTKKVTYCELFSKRYRGTLLVGCFLGVLNQSTGANAIAFYSNKIFIRGKEGYDAEHFARVATLSLGFGAFVSSGFAAILMAKYGRKSLLMFGFIGMSLGHGLLGVFAIYDWNPGILIFTVAFLVFFNISIGTVLAPYNAEILPDKGISIAQFINWGLVIVVTLITEQGFELIKAYGMYFVFCALNAIGLIFSLCIIKETKCKSKDEGAFLYAPKGMTIDSTKQKYHSMINWNDESNADENTN